MKLQVLVSTMHQKDYSLLDRMNIQTDAIVINQCDEYRFEEFEHKGKKIKWYSMKERGIGLSRNTALMRSEGDILLFADDDVVYEDGYEEIVLSAFKKNTKSSLIVFNLQSQNPERPEYIDSKDHKLKITNCLKYGAFRIAIRKESIVKENITYSLLFGGGARYSAGEDNLFITHCIQAGLICRASKEHIGTVKQEVSTWFSGYGEKYFMDRGSLFAALYHRGAKLMLFLMELKSVGRKCDFSFRERLRLGFYGIKKFRNILEEK